MYIFPASHYSAGPETMNRAIAEIEVERLLAKGFSSHEITKRMAAQVSDRQRENIADAVLTNDRDRDFLLRQVENLYETVLLPKARANSI